MKRTTIWLGLLAMICCQVALAQGSVSIVFEADSTTGLAESDRQLIQAITQESHARVVELLPTLSQAIVVRVTTTDRNIDIVGGVIGRSERADEVVVTLSSVYPGGLASAAQSALASTLFHEFHHLYRGWTIQGNRFGPGIAIAAVNEGMADVFAETYTGVFHEAASAYPDNVDVWLQEILALPVDANYQHWVSGTHPDGRSAIGYRVGRYLIHQAMRETGKDILEISLMSPEEILGVVLNR